MNWFTSDLHYFHKNITSGESNWSDKINNCRQFTTTKEMSQHIVKQMNKYVKEDDVLYFLGDWCFQGIYNIWNLRKQIRCKTIHFIYGNHDTHITKNKLLPNCGKVICIDTMEPLYIDKTDNSDDVYAQEIFTSFQEKLDVILDGNIFKLSHHPPQEKYNKQHYYLYGHVHGKDNFVVESKKLEVGIDNAYKLFGEYRPFNEDDIKTLLQC